MTVPIGVDIGGTGIKAAPIDLEQGALVAIDSPSLLLASTPVEVTDTLA